MGQRGLSHLAGNQLAMGFQERHLSVPAPVTIGGRQIKRYHVSVTDAPIEDDIRMAAEAFVPVLLPPADDTPPASFLVLHRGANAAYLLVYSWVWDNVLHCQTASAGSSFLGSIDGELTQFRELRKPWIGCVWELPALTHEPAAWVRHVLKPDTPDLPGYLADTLQPGLVGAGSIA
jgi:hypothetical protein